MDTSSFNQVENGSFTGWIAAALLTSDDTVPTTSGSRPNQRLLGHLSSADGLMWITRRFNAPQHSLEKVPREPRLARVTEHQVLIELRDHIFRNREWLSRHLKRQGGG